MPLDMGNSHAIAVRIEIDGREPMRKAIREPTPDFQPPPQHIQTAMRAKLMEWVEKELSKCSDHNDS
jgi:hypothetical protein